MTATFNQFVRKRLLELNLSQREFERLLGYADNGMRNVLKGRVGPRLQDLAKMAETLKLNYAEARTLRELALEAHGYQDLADELRDLHHRVDGLSRRVAEIENQYKV